jgi:hypothetical protein
VLESADTILNWDKSIITDKTVDFNRPDRMLIDRQSRAALVVVIAVPLTLNFPKTETEEITKYEKLAVEIKNTWNLTSLTCIPLSYVSGRNGHRKLPKISVEYRFNQKHLNSWTKGSTITDLL